MEQSVEKPKRHGRPWTRTEDRQLAADLGGQASIDEIAVAHQRTVGSIVARAQAMTPPEMEFPDPEQAVAWLRQQLCDGYDLPTALGALETVRDGKRSSAADKVRYPRSRIMELWEQITQLKLSAEHAAQFNRRPEVATLQEFDEPDLERAGSRLRQSRGELKLADWVLECDWSGVTELHLTADRIQTGGDDVASTICTLLKAGIKKISDQRDRDVLLRRLGLETGQPQSLESIAEHYGLSRERIRQLQDRGVRKARVHETSGVRRCWHYVHDVLDRLLADADDPALTVTAMLTVAMPHAPRDVATSLIARLAGYDQQSCDQLVQQVKR